MRGKHSSPMTYWVAWLYREWVRARIRGLIHWTPLTAPNPGCTAIIGMCSRLPDVMAANLRCLHQSRWPQLKKIVIAVDAPRSPAHAQVEADARATCPSLDVEFVYYSEAQSSTADRLHLPFVYSWLSWCLALSHVTTRHVLIHDYDALVLGPTLGQRYEQFVRSGATVQGISWYEGNGIESADRLATTFETFVDTAWLRSLTPISLFNKMRLKHGRSIDFDTSLDAQDRLLPESQRTIVPMNLDEMVHPSQMIHQYTMFRRQPAGLLPCFSMPMIPFFAYLSGKRNAISYATDALTRERRGDVDILGDGTRFNFGMLEVSQVDWALKQMVQAFIALECAPDHRIYEYGKALYRIIKVKSDLVWKGDFSAVQRRWIDLAAAG